jgi:hypothetical protein
VGERPRDGKRRMALVRRKDLVRDMRRTPGCAPRWRERELAAARSGACSKNCDALTLTAPTFHARADSPGWESVTAPWHTEVGPDASEVIHGDINSWRTLPCSFAYSLSSH